MALLALKRFAAGFLATLLFHQVLIAGLYFAKVIPWAPYSMAPAPPFGVPAVVSLAFWGGLWGILVLWLVDRFAARHPFAAAAVLGAIGPPLVAWFVVAPLKGRAMPEGVGAVVIALLINAIWAVGALLIVRLMVRRPATGVQA
jgi:hypothetical protein